MDQFDKNNEELKKINESPIPRSLQKETALEYFKEDFEEVKAEFLQGKIDIDNKEKELDEIKNRQLRDLGYDQIFDEILKKERKIKIWINALRNRRNTLERGGKAEKKAPEAVKVNGPAQFPGHELIRNFTPNMKIALRTLNAINDVVHPPEKS